MMNIKNEEIAREKAGQSPEDLEALSPEQIRQTLHELRVQQIELKMQNEQLHRAEEDLRNQNALLNAVINSAKDIILVALDKNYRYVAFNERHRQEMKAVYNVDIEIGQCMLDLTCQFPAACCGGVIVVGMGDGGGWSKEGVSLCMADALSHCVSCEVSEGFVG